MNKILCAVVLLISVLSCQQKKKDFYTIAGSSSTTTIYVSGQCDSLLCWAITDVAQSIESITGTKLLIKEANELPETEIGGNSIIVGLYTDELLKNEKFIEDKDWKGVWEQFLIKQDRGKLFIVGSDIRGTVYGIFDMAERIGISPWNWWADVKPLPRDVVNLTLPSEGILQSPSVKFRGIFLNDEDWGLQPWAAKTFEPETGDIGPKTYEKIFQLLLRLKANTIWPAMHHCTKPFFAAEGNKEMAEKYHIVLGSSHAEPMLRNNVREWDQQKNGAFNYFSNSKNVQQYWQDRVKETKNAGNECLYSMGMRGIHDSKMEGASSQEEMIDMMHTIIKDQRDMLATALEKSVEEIPQVLVPYKEVLDLYNAGLQVPDDISLMWCDDNYGYIRRLSSREEQKRSGGAGVYYHLSYWGRPHDYLWLSTTQPGLIWYEMTRAYQNGAKNIWIANVGDIKPAEYNTEFFLDLAWDINSINSSGVKDHLRACCARDFGVENADGIADVMQEYYRLAFLRKPEFMGWSQTEPTTKTHLSAFSTDANDNELQRRIDDYQQLVDKVERVKQSVNANLLDAFFQLVEYPVKGAALINHKFLYAQLADCVADKDEKATYKSRSQDAYRKIEELTNYYNKGMLSGKWDGMMNAAPRNLPVFAMPDFSKEAEMKETMPDLVNAKPVFIQAKNYTSCRGKNDYNWQSIDGLGSSDAAITLYPLSIHTFEGELPFVEYEFEIDQPGEYEIEIRCLPTHSNNFNHELRVQFDENKPEVYPLNTKGRSNEWKTNVLRNFVSVKSKLDITNTGRHQVKIFVNQTGIVIDQLAVKQEAYPAYYEIPNKTN
ncbi:glycosyl hydrolase 115 family protein [Labilibaculum euxinus]|uniref:Glycosyl hydrolase n=1 Tax=Labilibaculum euxinus TaxID=2686357 RepID=A0A7M4D1X6_9BACT|nr:glycosyl hydrolase 115 family protein [Labilibaculum euxinus]MUP36655.1 glycosyl hydrolase [Labilibaculum euxinus]MVB05860.1 glycosyl hydrolase [Labilibaculum euxinus]